MRHYNYNCILAKMFNSRVLFFNGLSQTEILKSSTDYNIIYVHARRKSLVILPHTFISLGHGHVGQRKYFVPIGIKLPNS